MISFKKYFVKEGVAHPYQTQGHEAHIETNVNPEKQKVIGNEIDFLIKSGVLKNDKTIVLGVVGAGSGLISHINQYRKLGYKPKQMFFFEKNRNFFLDIAGSFLTNILNIQPDDKKLLDTIGKNDKISIRLKGGFGEDKEINAILSRSADIPNLIQDYLPINGSGLNEINSKLKIEYDRSHTPPNSEKIIDLRPEYVSHIDFDITDNLVSAEKVIKDTRTFFTTYPALRSLVQVYYLQRKDISSEEGKGRWDVFVKTFSKQMEFVQTNIHKFPDRTISAIQDLVKRGEEGDPIAVEQTKIIKDALSAFGLTAYVQIYEGVSGRSLLSLTVVKGVVDTGIQDQIRAGMGKVNIDMVTSYHDKIEEYIKNNPQQEQFLAPYLEQIFNIVAKSESY